MTTMTAENPLELALAEQVNILIVDDEPNNLTVLETVLQDSGYQLVHASSGAQALMALMAHEFAVLVLDVNMPDMTGFELAQLIKKRKKTAQVPIIFLSAYYNEDQHVVTGYGSGAVDYLHKPVNVGILRSKVAIFADLYRKSRALEQANRALLAEIADRREAQERLKLLNETLERRVLERTNALNASDAQLRAADRRKDEFLATLAHELRNPLAPVGYAVRLLRLKAPENPDVQRTAALIERQVKAMGRLIDDLMDVSRINEGKIELRSERVRLAAVLQDAIEAARPSVIDCRHELILDLPEGELALDADPTRLAQAFMNLIVNAAKYMDHGGRIEIDVSPAAREVEIVFRDGGIGIAAERLESIFEMFSQVDTALTRSRGGLGIGLSLTRRLLELHGGSIMARSEGPGRGSQFVVRLPLAATADAPAQALHESATAPGVGVGRRLRVLVADDNRDAAATLTELFEAMGHTVRCVFDGRAAVAAALDFAPQLALLDIGMPELNGYEACRDIRRHPQGADIMICAVTGWGQAEDVRKALEAGFDDHLVKPLDADVLSTLLSRIAPVGAPVEWNSGSASAA